MSTACPCPAGRRCTNGGCLNGLLYGLFHPTRRCKFFEETEVHRIVLEIFQSVAADCSSTLLSATSQYDRADAGLLELCKSAS
jgi:hypothetical protein